MFYDKRNHFKIKILYHEHLIFMGENKVQDTYEDSVESISFLFFHNLLTITLRICLCVYVFVLVYVCVSVYVCLIVCMCSCM